MAAKEADIKQNHMHESGCVCLCIVVLSVTKSDGTMHPSGGTITSHASLRQIRVDAEEMHFTTGDTSQVSCAATGPDCAADV